jgi:peptidoglycan/xylan/chitin deacetylase (PgdA/CDA1 family)
METGEERGEDPALNRHGLFVISLDFELYWGVQDVMSLDQYKYHLLGVKEAVPRMLELFEEHGIHATWGTVGKLFFDSKSDMLSNLPELKPGYENQTYSGYRLMDQMDESGHDRPFYFAPSLIRQIASVPHQEIGTHTFSHYYCLETGQTPEEFAADLHKAMEIGKREGYDIQSIVFPRNQINGDYLPICRDLGLRSYRGTEKSPIYQACTYRESQAPYKRLLRLADAYANVSGHHVYSPEDLDTEPFINLPSSRFLRPYHPRLKAFEGLRLRRITKSLSIAAREKKMYHLWWHPHNFGVNLNENIQFLSKILKHYSYLNRHYGMQSCSMSEAATLVAATKGKRLDERIRTG